MAMTKDDIIRMAREAGFFANEYDGGDFNHMYYEVNFNEVIEDLTKFATLVAAAEREACAKLCDSYDVAEDVNSSDTAEGIAIVIRARDNNGL